jgi:fatty acid desaturase
MTAARNAVSARDDGAPLTAEIHAAVSGLLTVDRRLGVAVTAANVVILNALLAATFAADGAGAFAALAFLTALFYGSVMVTTHDAIHHTLSGLYWFDEIVPRAFGYFVFWPHGLYSELHKMHHRMNGRDLADPELPTYTCAAYERSGPLGRFAIRNQWWLSLFVYAGFGMIVRHVVAGLRLYKGNRVIRRLMWTDAIGIAAAATVTICVMVWAGVTWRYLIYLLIVERVLGFCMQLRSHIEHYGLYGGRSTLLATRLYNCRNVRTNAVVSRYFNGLNFHSVHHAFPGIPFNKLREAHRRVAEICARAGEPLVEGDGYWRTVRELAREPVLIAEDRLS